MHGAQRAAPAPATGAILAATRGGRADRGGRRPAPGVRAGAGLPRRHDRRLPGAGRARRRRVDDAGARRQRARPGSSPRTTACALQFHPHADSHVETQAADRAVPGRHRPAVRHLCLDTGHLAYRRADSVELIAAYPDRIGYVHIKQMDPAGRGQGRARRTWPSGRRWRSARRCEPPHGLPDVPVACVAALNELDAEIFVDGRAGHVPGATSTCPSRSPRGPRTTCAACGIGG